MEIAAITFARHSLLYRLAGRASFSRLAPKHAGPCFQKRPRGLVDRFPSVPDNLIRAPAGPWRVLFGLLLLSAMKHENGLGVLDWGQRGRKASTEKSFPLYCGELKDPSRRLSVSGGEFRTS